MCADILIMLASRIKMHSIHIPAAIAVSLFAEFSGGSDVSYCVLSFVQVA